MLALDHITDERGRFHDVTLALRAGEIVGLYGLVGAGRSELAQALVGLRPSRGRIALRGAPFAPTGPAGALAAGVALVPEDRRTDGVFATHSCRANVSAPCLEVWGTPAFRPRARAAAGRLHRAPARHALSRHRATDHHALGRHQQNCARRWLEPDPAVLLLDDRRAAWTSAPRRKSTRRSAPRRSGQGGVGDLVGPPGSARAQPPHRRVARGHDRGEFAQPWRRKRPWRRRPSPRNRRRDRPPPGRRRVRHGLRALSWPGANWAPLARWRCWRSR